MFEGLLQPMHLFVILIIALIVFGPGKLGDIGGQLGRAIKEFKRSLSEADKPEQAEQPKKLDQTDAGPQA